MLYMSEKSSSVSKVLQSKVTATLNMSERCSSVSKDLEKVAFMLNMSERCTTKWENEIHDSFGFNQMCMKHTHSIGASLLYPASEVSGLTTTNASVSLKINNQIYPVRFFVSFAIKILFFFCVKPRQDMSRRPYTLRFEDLAASPLYYTNKLYDFLGINLHTNVTQFIAKATNYTGSDLNRPYSTKRNSTQVLERWRHEMPWRMVKRVQEVCSVVMETLHYSPAVNESMLRDLSIELTKPDSAS